ncbi:hypothetical protein QFC22_004358 [Naganishia vaughanmartiniae]|uniref:Uncharacterized protein n=1 Tax=Naganishia vaughanmartiniae TaxID=1424756 RepID=A0ACC2X174_9TREE|nr:hypothetical protein QFC22_004358 [Naganishia vaughanmartiniae]
MSDLDAIRVQRLAQLRAQQGGGAGATPGFQLPSGMSPAPGGPGGGGNPEEDAAAKAQAAQQEEEMRRGMMGQLLESDARERLSRIALTRPSLARQIEDLLVRMARSGQLRGKVGDTELKGLLEQVSAQSQPQVSSTIQTGSRTKSLGAGITVSHLSGY